jgi:hypothetical protein
MYTRLFYDYDPTVSITYLEWIIAFRELENFGKGMVLAYFKITAHAINLQDLKKQRKISVSMNIVAAETESIPSPIITYLWS